MYQLPRLRSIGGLFHAISGVSDGNMSIRWGARKDVLSNRKRFLEQCGIRPADCVAVFLEHGTGIAAVDESFRGCGMSEPADSLRVDCLVTHAKGVFLFLLTGDCLPIVFYDPEKGSLALAHASRINTPMGFSRQIIEYLGNKGSKPQDILVGIGPGVRKESYVFSKEGITARIGGDAGDWDEFLTRMPDGNIGIDLVGYNVRQLISSGVREENIEVSDIDTIRDRNFFSHYRSRAMGEPEGRMATVVGMR